MEQGTLKSETALSSAPHCRTNAGLQHRPLVILLGAIAFGGGVTTQPASAQQNDWINTIRADNVRPDESDYPALNPHPTRVLELSGQLPQTLQIGFKVSYEADPDAGTVQAGNYCGFKLNSEAFPLYSIEEPLVIRRDAKGFHASVSIDKYLPARCRWHLHSIDYEVLNGAGPQSAGVVGLTYQKRYGGGDPHLVPNGRVIVWCKKNPYPPEPARPERCGNLSLLEDISIISPETLASFPLEDRKNRNSTWLFPDTDKIEVNFYDLDSTGQPRAQGPSDNSRNSTVARAVASGPKQGAVQAVAIKVGEIREDDGVDALDFTADGESLATKTYMSTALHIWAWRPHAERVRSLPIPNAPAAFMGLSPILKYSHDDRHLALLDDVAGIRDQATALYIWNTGSGQLTRSVGEPNNFPELPDLDWSAADQRLLTLYRVGRTREHQLVVLRTEDGAPDWRLNFQAFTPQHMASSPNGKLAAVGGLITGRGLAAHAPIELVDLASHAIVSEIDAFPSDCQIVQIAWNPDGTQIAAGATFNGGFPNAASVRVFSVATGAPFASALPPGQNVWGIAYANAGKYLIVSSTGDVSAVTIWDSSLKTVLQTIPLRSGVIPFIAVSRHGRLLAIAEGPLVSIWEVR
jgi:WD40 repeat protein